MSSISEKRIQNHLITGFFETIYYNNEDLCHLDRHLARIYKSLETFDLQFEPTSRETIQQAVNLAGLKKCEARVNITYTSINKHPEITAIAYTQDPLETFSLTLYPDTHDSFMARHKSLSYMPYFLAYQHAKKKKFHDAILVDSTGQLLETSRAALLFKINGRYAVSLGKNKLPSITLALAEEQLGPFHTIPITRKTLTEIDQAWVLNSLIGIRSIERIDNIYFDVQPITNSSPLMSNSIA